MPVKPIELCPGCGRGFLLLALGERSCTDCPYRVSDTMADQSPPLTAASVVRPTPTPPLPQEEPPVAFSNAWIARHEKTLGPSCLITVRQILDRLGHPFMRPGNGMFAHLTLPCFFDDPEYMRERARIVRHLNSTEWTTAQGKIEEVKQRLAHLPPLNQDAAQTILWLCDEHRREKVVLEDCCIRWFGDTLAQEHDWLTIQRHLLTWRKQRGRSHWTARGPFQSHLFSFQFDPLLTVRYCDEAQRALDRARPIVEEARTALEPARTFYLGARFPRAVKKALIDSLLVRQSSDKKHAAVLGTALFGLADPNKEPVSPEDLRSAHYDR